MFNSLILIYTNFNIIRLPTTSNIIRINYYSCLRNIFFQQQLSPDDNGRIVYRTEYQSDRQIELRLNDFQQAKTKLLDNFFITGVKIICILVGSTSHKIRQPMLSMTKSRFLASLQLSRSYALTNDNFLQDFKIYSSP